MRFKTIQAARAVAANAVMLSHLLIVEQKDGQGFTFLSDWFHLGACGVDLFFVLSGFVMVAIASSESWATFVLARITRIFPPYWFYSGLVLIVLMIAPNIVNSALSHPPSIWRSFLLVPDTVDPLLAVGWPLIHEIYFYLIFAALLATGNIRFGSLCVWAAVVLAARLAWGITATQETAPLLAVVTHPLTFEFIGGACVGLLIRSGRTSCAALSVFVGGALLAGLLIMTDNPFRLVATHAPDWARVLKVGLPFVFIVYGITAFETRSVAIRVPNWIVSLGDASYSTYLAHILVLSALGRCFAFLSFHNLPLEALFVTVCIIGTNAVGLLSYHYLEHPTLVFFRRPFSQESLNAVTSKV